MTGRIKSLVFDKGYGFIKPDDSGAPVVFFHMSGLDNAVFDDLRVGQSVSFALERTEKGPRAEDVRVE
jgi:CspA family cold shock protein